MVIEGFVVMQHQGRYGIYNREGLFHELNCEDRIEVDTGQGWIEMRVKQDFEGYYLSSKVIIFYPKMVYARLMND